MRAYYCQRLMEVHGVEFTGSDDEADRIIRGIKMAPTMAETEKEVLEALKTHAAGGVK